MSKKNKIIIILSILVILLFGMVMIFNHNKNKSIETNNDSVISQDNTNNTEGTKQYEIKDLGRIECEMI